MDNLEKVFEGIFRDDYAEFAVLNLEQVNEVVQNFRKAVGRRNMDFHESLQDDYNLIEHAVAYLKNYYAAKMKESVSEADTRAARIFATFLRGQVDNLKGYAEQIDEEYAE